jgi:hypothetical protein
MIELANFMKTIEFLSRETNDQKEEIPCVSMIVKYKMTFWTAKATAY